jgi:hypothetical protein
MIRRLKMDDELSVMMKRLGCSAEEAKQAIQTFRVAVNESDFVHEACISTRRNKSDRKRNRANRWS